MLSTALVSTARTSAATGDVAPGGGSGPSARYSVLPSSYTARILSHIISIDARVTSKRSHHGGSSGSTTPSCLAARYMHATATLSALNRMHSVVRSESLAIFQAAFIISEFWPIMRR